MRVDFSKGGRTKPGLESTQDHTLDPWVNLLDGITQEDRKKTLKKKQATPNMGPEEEVISRIVGAGDFARDLKEMIEEAGGERFPGLGTLRVFDVGPHRSGPVEMTPDESFARLKDLHEKCFYLRPRSDRPATAPLQKVRPGLIKKTLPTTPWHDAALKRCLTEGIVKADEVVQLLKEICWMLGEEVPKATKLKTAAAGVAVEFVAAHLQQGVLHFHPYIRDVDLETHERLGLFLSGAEAGQGLKSGRPRLILNSLGVGALTQLNLREAGMPAVPKILKNSGDKGAGVSIIRGWRILETALLKRKEKELGESWDVVVNRKVNNMMETFFSVGDRRRILDEEIERSRKKYESEKQQAEAEIAELTGSNREAELKIKLDEAERQAWAKVTELQRQVEKLRRELEAERAKRLSAEARLRDQTGSDSKSDPLKKKRTDFEQGVDALQRIQHGNGVLSDLFWLSSGIHEEAGRLLKSKSQEATSAREFFRLRALVASKPITQSMVRDYSVSLAPSR